LFIGAVVLQPIWSRNEKYCVTYAQKETMPQRLELRADELGLSVEQLIRRLIADGMGSYGLSETPNLTSSSLDEYLVKSGVKKKD
tara:strand:- start:189 stop:443 length:255 start_codon:yes stop_codon:yes gene_type:complete